MTLSILLTPNFALQAILLVYFLSLLCLGVIIAAGIVWLFDESFLRNFLSDWRL